MIYSKEVEEMCVVARDGNHGCAPIPEEAKWVKAKEVKDISGFTHGVGWCAPQQGACKLSLNIKEGIIQEALVETIGCSGMTHSAAMAAELLPGRTVLEALNTDLVCDAINTAMRELFLQIVYGRSQSAFSEEGLPVGAGLEDLGNNFALLLIDAVGLDEAAHHGGRIYIRATTDDCTGVEYAVTADFHVIAKHCAHLL
jgi:NifU-like protein involved in Fe-S cluster formation